MAEETTPSLGDETRRAALVVAVSRYSDPMLRQLRAPAQDAAELGTVLGDPELGDFSVTTVTDGRAHEIRIAVEEFLAEQRPGDLSLVYLSCHGLMDARRRLYFAATDTLKNRLAATGIEARWLLDQLEECRARRQVIILDCCFSGAFAAGSKGEGDLGLGDRFLGQGRGRVVLTASRGTEYSFEGSPTPHSAIPGSVFTSALAAGIRTGAADRDDDGWVTVDDAYVYAFDEMRAAGAEQTPQRWLYGAEGGIVLARNPTAAGSGPPPRTEPTARPTPGRHDDQAERDDVLVNLPRVRIPRFNFRERWRRYAAVSGALVIAAIAGVAVYTAFFSPAPGFSFKNDVVESTGPWRMHLFSDVTSADGCTVTLTDLDGGNTLTVPRDPAYGQSMWQMQATGRFRLEPSQTGCEVNAENGAGDESIPLKVIRGDSESFNPSGTFTVQVDEFGMQYAETCQIVLRDGETGTTVDTTSVTPQRPTQQMDPGNRSSLYLSNVPCPVTVIDN